MPHSRSQRERGPCPRTPSSGGRCELHTASAGVQLQSQARAARLEPPLLEASRPQGRLPGRSEETWLGGQGSAVFWFRFSPAPCTHSCLWVGATSELWFHSDQWHQQAPRALSCGSGPASPSPGLCSGPTPLLHGALYVAHGLCRREAGELWAEPALPGPGTAAEPKPTVSTAQSPLPLRAVWWARGSCSHPVGQVGMCIPRAPQPELSLPSLRSRAPGPAPGLQQTSRNRTEAVLASQSLQGQESAGDLRGLEEVVEIVQALAQLPDGHPDAQLPGQLQPHLHRLPVEGALAPTSSAPQTRPGLTPSPLGSSSQVLHCPHYPLQPH